MSLVQVIFTIVTPEATKYLSNPETQRQLIDFIQETSGNVNRDNLHQAVEKACKSCTKKTLNEQMRVMAFVTALYMQNDIKRAAQVGGSLRKRFGVTWFPFIKERELHYALDVDIELEEFLYNELVTKGKLDLL